MKFFRYLRFACLTLLLQQSAFASSGESEKWQSPLSIDGAETISVEQAQQAHKNGVLFVDVRSPRQFSKRHIPGALNLYVKNAFTEQALLKHVDKQMPFVVYCNGTHCSLSSKAARKAIGWGFTDVKYFREGARGWRLAGNQLETGS